MRPQQSTESALPEKRRGGAKSGSGDGLTSEEARRLLATLGSNAMPDTAMHPLRMALEKFWAPVPSMREAAIALQIVLGDYVSAAIIAVLLAFNAGLGLFQESRAQATLAALKSRLALNASVRRNGAWTILPAAELVPGDVVKLSLGGVVAADVRLTEGGVLLDQSILTGESIPIEAGPGVQTFAGALVRRGEAVTEVTATSAHTKFGRTGELVRTAHVVSTQQKAVLRVAPTPSAHSDDNSLRGSRRRPMILMNGTGAEFRQPLGYAIVSGLIVSQVLTLFITPVVYIYLDRLRRRRANSTLGRQPQPTA